MDDLGNPHMISWILKPSKISMNIMWTNWINLDHGSYISWPGHLNTRETCSLRLCWVFSSKAGRSGCSHAYFILFHLFQHASWKSYMTTPCHSTHDKFNPRLQLPYDVSGKERTCIHTCIWINASHNITQYIIYCTYEIAHTHNIYNKHIQKTIM